MKRVERGEDDSPLLDDRRERVRAVEESESQVRPA